MTQRNENGGNQALHWEHETTLRRGEVRADITSASFGADRRGYSVVLARQMDERISKFLRPQDIDELAALLPEIQSYLGDSKARDRGQR